MAAKPDWFKVYPALMMQDGLVDSMTMEELGCAFKLLCRQWIDGFIPDDLDRISRICRTDRSRMGDLWVTLCHYFHSIGEGKLANRYMFIERERVCQELEEKSKKGYESARKRWDSVVKNIDGLPMHDPLGDPMQDKDKDKDKDKEKRPPSRKRRTAPQIIQGFSGEVRRVVNTLGPVWPDKGTELETSRTIPEDFCQRVDEILETGVSADDLIEAATEYIKAPRKRYSAPQFFFGKKGFDGGAAPWVGYVKAIATRRLSAGITPKHTS